MSDAREIVEAIIDSLLDKMELEVEVEMEEQENFARIEFENFDRMEFNWIEMDPIYEG